MLTHGRSVRRKIPLKEMRFYKSDRAGKYLNAVLHKGIRDRKSLPPEHPRNPKEDSLGRKTPHTWYLNQQQGHET
jgi:hypothetical protein